MHLDDLASFLLVAETESFSAAARRSGIPLSTLSRRVAVLEMVLGEALFYRSTRRVSLTPRGEALAYDAREAVAAARRALKKVPEDSLSGPLRVSCPSYSARVLCRDAFGRFSQAYPDVMLELVLTNSSLDLVEHGLDLAIRSGPLPDSALKSRKLFEQAFWLFGDGNGSTRYTLQQLPDLPAIVTPPLERWTFLNDHKRVETVTPKSVFRVNDLELAAQAATDGVGIAYLPEYLGQLYKLMPLTLTGLAPERKPVLAVWNSAAPASRKARKLMDFLSSGVSHIAQS